MKTPSPYALHQEALNLALWEVPTPRLSPQVATSRASDGGEPEPVSQESSVGHVSVGDGTALPDLGALATFSTWQSVASTILHKVETLAGFDPHDTAFNPFAWNEYIRKFSTLPFLLSFTSNQRDILLTPLSLKEALLSVKSLSKKVISADELPRAITSMKKVAQLAVQTRTPAPGDAKKLAHLHQGILSVLEGQLLLGIFRATVQMEHKPDKGYEQIAQQTSLLSYVGVLDFNKCLRGAATLLNWPRQSVADWEAGTSSAPVPPNSSPAWES